MLFSKLKVAVYLTESGVEVIEVGKNNTSSFSFPDGTVTFGEIIDENRLRQEFLVFLKELKLKEKDGAIFLSSNLVYLKNIDITSNKTVPFFENFIKAIPIKRDNLSVMAIQEKNKVQLYATNKRLYQIIIDVLKNINLGVHSVAPIIKKPTPLTIKKIFDESIATEKYNFLKSKEINLENFNIDNKTGVNNKKIRVFLIISFLMFFGSVIYLLLVLGTIPNPWFSNAKIINPIAP